MINEPPDNIIGSTGFVVITPNTAPSSFVYCATTTDDFVAYLMNRAKGAAYPAVKPSDFEDAQ